MAALEKSREQLARELEEVHQRLARVEAAKTRAEAALQQSEVRFQAFLDNSPCVAFLKDDAGRLVYGNAPLDRLLSTKERSFMGRTDYELFPAEIARRLRENDARVLTTRQPLETIEAVPDGAGTLRDWLVMKFPVPDVSGDLASGGVLVGGVAVDITEHRRVDTELRHKNAILHSILESMAEGVVVADETGKFLLVNRATEQLAGVGRIQAAPEEWAAKYGLFLTDGVTPMPAEQVPLTRAMRGETVEAIDLYLSNMEVGEGRWLNVTGRPLQDRKGTHRGGVVVFRDVTERRHSEMKLKEYAQELQTLSRRLLHIQEEERRHLARELHDEVGQALTALKLTFEKASLAQLGPTREIFAKAIKSVQELMVRVRGLSMHLRPSLLDDLGLVAALQWHCKQYAEQTGVRVTIGVRDVETGERLPRVVETAAYRIVQEALTNVARHAHVNEATVQVGRERDMLLVRIEDKGPGFNASDFRESSGIAGMRERATLLGGRLMVQSRPGEGTRVMAHLPLEWRFR